MTGAADDLTRIKGIGRATAERLAQADAGSFAALAAADPEALAAHDALRGVRASPADIPAWIAAAAELAGGQDIQSAKDSPEGVVPPADRAETPHKPGAVPPGKPTGGTTPAGSLASEIPPGPVLVVTGPKRGRWRAGRLFGPVPTRLSVALVTDAERAAIEADPALTAEVEEPQEPGA